MFYLSVCVSICLQFCQSIASYFIMMKIEVKSYDSYIFSLLDSKKKIIIYKKKYF